LRSRPEAAVIAALKPKDLNPDSMALLQFSDVPIFQSPLGFAYAMAEFNLAVGVSESQLGIQDASETNLAYVTGKTLDWCSGLQAAVASPSVSSSPCNSPTILDLNENIDRNDEMDLFAGFNNGSFDTLMVLRRASTASIAWVQTAALLALDCGASQPQADEDYWVFNLFWVERL
jgi:hypothetical protein